MTALKPTAFALAALLLAASQAAHAQAFRCQYADGHIEYSQSTCPFGTKAVNVAMPNLKPKAAAASAPPSAPAPTASAALPTAMADLGPEGQPPVTWGMVDVDYRGVSVRSLFETLAKLVNKKAVVDGSVANRVVAAHYHDVPWDEAVADIAARAGLDVRDEGTTLRVKKKR